MSAPTTPRRQLPSTPEAPKTPVTPRNRELLEKTLRDLAHHIRDEEDDAQRQAMIQSIGQFAATLATRNNLPLPGAGSVKKRDRRVAEGEQSDSDDDDEIIEEEDSDDEEVQTMETETMEMEVPDVSPKPLLSKLTLAMSSDVGTGDLARIQRAFFRSLVRVQVKVSINNKKETVKFGNQEAVDITNFFFGEMMGASALSRLSSLIRFYSSDYSDGVDKGTAARAALLADNAETPISIRRFFGAFSKAQQSRNSTSTHFAHMQQTNFALDLLNQFNTLRQMAHDRDSGLLEFLRRHGFTTKRGVTWQSCIINYLATSLDISTVVLQNTSQAAQGVAGLVEQFGPGIVTILPPGVMNKLNRWGNQRMARVYPLLRKHVACFQPVCDLLKKHLYNPIQNGTALPMHALKMRVGGSLMEKITEALEDEDMEDFETLGVDEMEDDDAD